MALLLCFAFLSGMATVVSPCILPVLPIVLSSSVGGDRRRPIGVVLGMVASFAAATLALSAVVATLRIPPDVLRTAGIVIIAAAGLSLLVPEVRLRVERLLARVGQFGARLQGDPEGNPRRGLGGGLVLGAALGLVWAPCAGPILASVIVLAATNAISTGVAGVIIAYALGAGLPMLGIAYGGQWVVGRVRRTSRHAGTVQRVFGALMVATALAMVANVDRSFEVWAVSALPAGWSTPLIGLEQSPQVHRELLALKTSATQAGTAAAAGGPPAGAGNAPAGAGARAADAVASASKAPVASMAALDAKLGLQNLGKAPDFAGITRWFNTPRPLTMASLRGKVVLVDFWTYSCINCLRTLPHVTDWYRKYQGVGLVVVGVHTPEFPFEYVASNVAQAIRQLHITYSVAMDNKYATWNAYNNEYWPAEYLIDAQGVIRYTSFGEGDYSHTEQVIQQLLRDAGRHFSMPLASVPDMTPNHPQTPETYVGSDRLDQSQFASPQSVTPGHVQDFTTPSSLATDQFALSGRWEINPSEATVMQAGAGLDFDVTGSKVFVVLSPRSRDERVHVWLDGKPVVAGTNAGSDVKNGVLHVGMDNLYNVLDFQGKVETNRHLHLVFDTPGTEVFSFTFG